MEARPFGAREVEMDSRTTGRSVASPWRRERTSEAAKKTWWTVGVILLAIGWSACCSAQDFAALTPEDAHAWRTECKPAFDCTKPIQPKACCLAMSPECLRCAEEGRAAKAAFDFACFGETTPMSVVADCSAPPPLTPCCKALIPKCLDCVAKNRYQAELHRAQCGDAP